MKHKNIHEKVAGYVITRDIHELSQLTRYKIADHFGINRSYLSTKFKEATGKTVLEFLTFEKMKRAEILLRIRQNLPVKRISERIGIINLCQFRKKFQEIYGLKPGKYRSLFKR